MTLNIPATEAANTLFPIARASIAGALGKTQVVDESAAWLHQHGASFITLNLDQKLRGCIGSLHAHRSLLEDVKTNARAAAFNDPRFKPLTAAEYVGIEMEISLLSALSALRFTDEASALTQLTPHVHGVIFEYGHHRSTYLPQVWTHFTDPAMFLATLKQKAGLPPNFWEPGVKLHTYTVTKLRETPPNDYPTSG
ncbi:MAG: AmmeMemoRadiSam system protein A [Betaproteobacteria bacterium]|nr:AmmeMemoRadiSam system protein A [Betaproteobacteria bacterium]